MPRSLKPCEWGGQVYTIVTLIVLQSMTLYEYENLITLYVNLMTYTINGIISHLLNGQLYTHPSVVMIRILLVG